MCRKCRTEIAAVHQSILFPSLSRPLPHYLFLTQALLRQRGENEKEQGQEAATFAACRCIRLAKGSAILIEREVEGVEEIKLFH